MKGFLGASEGRYWDVRGFEAFHAGFQVSLNAYQGLIHEFSRVLGFNYSALKSFGL